MKLYIKLLLLFLVLIGCDDFLEEEVYTEYEPGKFLASNEGVDALLTGAYSTFVLTRFQHNDDLWLQEVNTDILWETGGGVNRLLLPLIEFSWDANHPYFQSHYNRYYNAIAAANNVLAVVNDLDELDLFLARQIQAEARFIRGTSYYILHDLFGTTPIIEIPENASLDEIESIGKETPRATEEQYRAYVEADLMFAADNLEFGGVSSRANRGSALAVLTKFYLNNKQWGEAAETAKQIIDSGNYQLYDDYVMLFSVDGEDNNEYIFRYENLVGSNQQLAYMPLAFPPNYPIQSNWQNFGAQARTYTAFYETFDTNDIRRNAFIREYIPTTTGVITPLDRDGDGNVLDDVRSFKYVPDPNANGRWNGNDVPLVRYADIILARAEALNMLNGPVQESIDLINLIRDRASAAPVLLSDFADATVLNDFILAERARELFTERLRRQDLIRHGKFIERALERGKPAQPFHVLYPFPQAQIDNNPNLEQNQGY